MAQEVFIGVVHSIDSGSGMVNFTDCSPSPPETRSASEN